jgi:hypothetical protein
VAVGSSPELLQRCMQLQLLASWRLLLPLPGTHNAQLPASRSLALHPLAVHCACVQRAA